MTTLGDAFEAWYDDHVIKMIGHVVDNAIFPFNPGKIEAYLWYDIDQWSHTIKATVERLPKHDFLFVINSSETLANPDNYLDKFYQELFKHFRYRPSLPVDDHILLGED